MVDCLKLTENSGIGLLGEGNVSNVLPTHLEIFHFYKIKATGSSLKLFHQYNLGVHIGDYMQYNWL